MTWSVNEPLAANGPMTIGVYGNIGAGLTAGAFTGTLTVSGVGQTSGQPVTSMATQGQTITIGQGSLTAVVDASSPVSALVVGATVPKVASFKFTAQNDSFIITELAAMVVSESDATAITELIFKDGATELARVPFTGIYATATGLSVALSSNSNKVIDVYANLGSIGTGFANPGANVGVTLIGYKAQNSGGGELSYGVNLSGNALYAYKTKPTITNVALPTTVPLPGLQTIYKFNVTADAGGTLAWRKIALNIATSSLSGSFTVSDYKIYDAANESVQLTNVSSSNTGNVITFTSTADQEVGGSKTYVIKALVTGTVTTGASISTNMMSSSLGFTAPTDTATVQATSASFVWSDEAITPHSGTTADWNNDYLVKNLPTDPLILAKP
jgi:hypothetical protein